MYAMEEEILGDAGDTVFSIAYIYGTYVPLRTSSLSNLISMLRTKITTYFLWFQHMGTDRRIKAWLEWPIEVGLTGLVLIDGRVEACGAYLTSGHSSLIRKSGELEALFHTRRSCQLQDVDWWPESKQSLRACETCALIERMSLSDLASKDTSRTETRSLIIFRNDEWFGRLIYSEPSLLVCF
jgi:hypothetical protein